MFAGGQRVSKNERDQKGEQNKGERREETKEENQVRKKEAMKGRRGLEEDRLNIASYNECKIPSELLFKQGSSLAILTI